MYVNSLVTRWEYSGGLLEHLETPENKPQKPFKLEEFKRRPIENNVH